MFRSLAGKIALVLAVVLLMWIVLLIDNSHGSQLTQFGIRPRSPGHWFHIGLAPFIHGSVAHLAANSAGMLVFGLLTIFRSRGLFIVSSAFIILVGGALVWAFGRPALHFGASGWIYGLWALTIGIAWFDRKSVNILIAFLVLLFYGGMTYGLLPMKPSVSIEMHIAGIIAGTLCALFYVQLLKKKELQ